MGEDTKERMLKIAQKITIYQKLLENAGKELDKIDNDAERKEWTAYPNEFRTAHMGDRFDQLFEKMDQLSEKLRKLNSEFYDSKTQMEQGSG